MSRLARTVVAFALATVALTACGSGLSIGKIRSGTGAPSSSNTTAKDCAACKKMCEVGGSAEKNEGGVEACKKDCEKTCK